MRADAARIARRIAGRRTAGRVSRLAGLVGVLGAVGGGWSVPGVEAQEPRAAVADSVVELEGLEVSVASRLVGDAHTRAVTLLDRPALEALSATTVSEALRWAAGVDLRPRSLAQADVAVRGGTFEQVVVLVDGVPMSDAQTGHFDLDVVVPLAGVERIEVLRGAGSAVHGADAMGGVINIVTRPASAGPRGQAQLEAGGFGRAAGSLRLASALGRWTAAASGRVDRSDGHRDGTDHDMRLADLSLHGPVGRGSLTLRIGAAARDFGADGFYAPFPSYEETRTRTLSARYTRGTAVGIVDLVVHGREHDDDFVLRRGDPAFYQNVHESRQTGVDVTMRSVPRGPWVWSVGVAGARDALESTNLGARSAGRGATFGELGWNGDAVRLRGGLRLDGRADFAPTWAPSLSAAWSPSATVGLRAALGRSFRAPTWTDRYYEDPANRGDPDLAVETAWSGEAGLDLRAAGGGLFRLTAFLREARDLIDYARPADGPDDAVWQSRNVESARFRGVELEVGGFSLGPVVVDGALELLDVESDETGDFVSKYALRPLTRSAVIGARVPLGAGISAALRVENRRRSEEPDRTAADLRLEARLGSSRLWVDATNLGDAHWLDVSGLPAPGRSLRTGVSIDFGGATR